MTKTMLRGKLMEAVFDRIGDVVAWYEEDIIYDNSGVAIALLDADQLFSFPGKHLGILDTGYFRDHSGRVVGFLKSASGPLKLPECGLIPRPPKKQTIPHNFGTAIPPMPSLPCDEWSPVSWYEYIYGHTGGLHQVISARGITAPSS